MNLELPMILVNLEGTIQQCLSPRASPLQVCTLLCIIKGKDYIWLFVISSFFLGLEQNICNQINILGHVVEVPTPEFVFFFFLKLLLC